MLQLQNEERTALDTCKQVLSYMLLASTLVLIAMIMWALTHSTFLMPRGEQTSASFWKMWLRVFLPLLSVTGFCTVGVLIICAHQTDEKKEAIQQRTQVV